MAHKVTGDNKVEGALLLKENAAPSETTGYATVYAKTDKALYYKDSDGAEHSVGGGSGDVYDRNTLLLLPFTGADAATKNIKDSSVYNHTTIFYGNAQIDTAQYKYGSSSALFDGSGDEIIIPYHPVFQIGLDDFTVEAWIRLATDVNTSGEDARIIVGMGRVESDNGAWCFGVGHASTWGTGIRLNLSLRSGGSIVWASSDSFTMVKDTWYHVALVRSSGTVKFYLDGVAKGTGTTRAENLLDEQYAWKEVSIGARFQTVITTIVSCFNGWIQDVRISKVARYTADFTVPSGLLSPYE